MTKKKTIKDVTDAKSKQIILIDDLANPPKSLDQNSKPPEGPWMYLSKGDYQEDTKFAEFQSEFTNDGISCQLLEGVEVFR